MISTDAESIHDLEVVLNDVGRELKHLKSLVRCLADQFHERANKLFEEGREDASLEMRWASRKALDLVNQKYRQSPPP